MSDRLTPEAIEGFVNRYLIAAYSQPVPVKDFHRTWWQMSCDRGHKVVIAAPRGHSKSTTINHGYSVAAAALRTHPYQIKLSSTRDIAIEFLQTDKKVFAENEQFQRDFGFKGFSKEAVDDFIADFEDGYQCRMRAFGAEQRMRGIKWDHRRPDLILADDLEDDEQVMNQERRDKLQKWWNRVIMPIGHNETDFRVIGTVLDKNSLLNKLLAKSGWISARYKAHADAFTNILWPERFPISVLREIRQSYMDDFDLIGYNMEYLNEPTDKESGFFQTQDFVGIPSEQMDQRRTFYVGGDLAISQNTQRDRSCFVVGGMTQDNFLDVFDVRRGHWDAKEIVDEMFAIQDAYDPEEWFIEDGTIKKAMGSYFELRMRQERSGKGYLNIAPRTTPTADKRSRARPLQGRMRQRSVRFNKYADWYPDFEREMLAFRGANERNDQPDAAAWLGIGLDRMNTPSTAEEDEYEMLRFARQQAMRGHDNGGRSRVTGY